MIAGPDPGGRRLGRLLCAFCAVCFALGSHGYIDNPDAEVEFQTARALVRRGSTGLRADLADSSAAERALLTLPKPFDLMRGRDGSWYSWFGIGHAASMAPFYAAGRGLAALFPGVEGRYAASWERDHGGEAPAVARAYGEEFWSRFLVAFHSPLFGAAACWFLFRILRHLGLGAGISASAVLLAAFTTQFGPETRESMADTTATALLLAALERLFALRETPERRAPLVLAALAAGAAFLCRPFLALSLPLLAAYAGARAERGRRLRAVLIFGAVLVPFGLFQLWFDWARFGDPFETGYSAGTAEGYWSFPFFLGFVLLAFSPGKGAFVFSPLLWLVPQALRRGASGRGPEILTAAGLMLVPWLLASCTAGWHSSQAWADRYMTAGAFLLGGLAAGFVLAEGTRRLRALLAGLAVLGLLIQLGGWLAPYRGYYDLAFRAAAARWPSVPAGDRIHHLASDPRTSPVFGHWLYAAFSLDGAIPAGPGPKVFGALFGTPLPEPPVPRLPEDQGFRHFFWLGVSRRLGAWWPGVLGLLLAAGALGLGLRLRAEIRRSDASWSTERPI